jgi:hypothetical protein
VLCQGDDLSLIRPSLDKPDHVEQILAAETSAVFSHQLSRQCRDNLIAVLRAGGAEDIAPYSIPDHLKDPTSFPAVTATFPDPRGGIGWVIANYARSGRSRCRRPSMSRSGYW